MGTIRGAETDLIAKGVLLCALKHAINAEWRP